MKTNALLILFVFTTFNIYSQNSRFKKYERKNKDILSLNAIVADKEYYSQAILEYEIVKKVLDKYKRIDTTTLYNFGNKKKAKIVRLLASLEQYESEKIGVKPCSYVLPQQLSDLKSGFQFRHYLFRGENSTALQAFGIINNNFNKEDLYVVIDYIQYQDCSCDDLPKIRYAVGIRSEFKITGMQLNKDNSNSNSLSIEKLAANVEFDKLKVDISMKTIGITGKPARLNIPSNTSFNVETYAEYVKVIDFIRNSLENPVVENDSINKVVIQPEIIPVMDQYRTSISDINTASFDELLEIKKRYKKYKRKFSKNKEDVIAWKIDSILKKSLLDEVELKNKKRKQLSEINSLLKNLDKYEKILGYVSTGRNTDFIEVADKNQYNKLRLKYNNAVELITKNEIEKAKKKLEEIRKEKHNYGNAFEILSLLNNENSLQNIRTKILQNYTWLLNSQTISKLKQL